MSAPTCCADCEYSHETGRNYDTCDHPSQELLADGHGLIISDVTRVEVDCPLRGVVSDITEVPTDPCEQVARDCHDPAHDDRWCPTCEARADGIRDYQAAQEATTRATADVYRHLATTDPARPCRDLPGILDAIRNVASRREPPTAVANILAELRRMDIAERRAKRTPPRYDDVYRAGVEAMATACNCGGRSCPDCGDDDARFS